MSEVDILRKMYTDPTIHVLDHGFVKLVDLMPRLCPEGRLPEYAICQAARVSYGDGTKKISEDQTLLRYLLRNKHTSPFEMIEFKFHIRLPIFVERQMVRHRTCSMNEQSARYSVLKDDFYVPRGDAVREQSLVNKQGGDKPLELHTALSFSSDLADLCKESYSLYTKYLGENVAREIARTMLPINIYTEKYWKMDLHNLLHFLKLRLNLHAQYEIRVYAQAIYDLIKPLVPTVIAAFDDYINESMALSKAEIQLIASAVNNQLNLSKIEDILTNKREQLEFCEKCATLNIEIIKDSTHG